MNEFQQLVSAKARELREALERAGRTEELSQRLLSSMAVELQQLEAGAITLPYDISRWGIYVGPDYALFETHPEVAEAFGELEIALDFSDMSSYLQTRSELEAMAQQYRRPGGSSDPKVEK